MRTATTGSKLAYARGKWALPALMLGVLPSCGLLDGAACPAVITPAIEVVAVDAVTGLAPSSTGAIAVARAGEYVDSTLTPVEGAALHFTLGWRPGTYAVTVRVPGYRAWGRSGVRVETDGKDVCPLLRTVQLAARLQPE